MIDAQNMINHEEKKVSVSSSQIYKQIKITFNNEIKTTSSVASFEDLVRYMFNENEL